MPVDTRAEVAAEHNAKVPLRRKMDSAWDVAHACLFLASDEGQLHHRRDAARGRRRAAASERLSGPV